MQVFCFFLICVIQTPFARTSLASSPILTFGNYDDWQNDWDKIKIGIDDRFVAKKNQSSLELICEAPYPIQWGIAGYLKASEDSIQFNSSKTVFPGKFRIELKIVFTLDKTTTVHATSAKISCVGSQIQESSLKTAIRVFVPGRNSKERVTHIDKLRRATVIYGLLDRSGKPLSCPDGGFWNTVRCPIVDPGESALELLPGEIVNRKDNPVDGYEFYSKVEHTTWKCRVGKESSSPLEFKTVNINANDHLAFDLEGNVGDVQKLCGNSDTAYFYSQQARSSSCNKPFEETWIHFHNYGGNLSHEIVIGSDHPTTEGVCLKSKNRTHFEALSAFRLPLRAYREPLLYASLWKNASSILDTLLKMDLVDPILFRNGTQTFTCTKGLRVGDIEFMVELNDGSLTQQNIHECDRYQVSDSVPEIGCQKLEPSDIDSNWSCQSRLNGSNPDMEILECNLPKDAVGVHCVAKWWLPQLPQSSVIMLRAKQNFRVKYYYLPKINVTNLQTEVEFYVGDPYKLECKCTEETSYPNLTYSWIYHKIINGISATRREPNLPSGVSQNGSVLNFPSAGMWHTGIYTCIAVSNVKGYDEIDFKVMVVGTNVGLYIGISTGVTFLLILPLICGLVILFRKFREQKALIRMLTEDEVTAFFEGPPDMYSKRYTVTQETANLLPYKKEYELDVDDTVIDYGSVFGTGQFAIVVKARIKSNNQEVAVKISKPTTDVNRFMSMLYEVKIMLHVEHHDHIVSIIGASTKDIKNRNVYIYMELCENGSLEKYLRTHKSQFVNLINTRGQIDIKLLKEDKEGTINTCTLIRWAGEVAAGMEYLASKSIVHADLATRNVLLNVHKVAKISDFGLSKQLYESKIYTRKTKTPLPWRWMPYESLNTLAFSTKSDVYSYGMTIWEIFTLGDVPFSNEVWTLQFMRELGNGKKSERPTLSTLEIYSTMTHCWEVEPERRPTFSYLRQYFVELLNSVVQIAEDVFEKENPNLCGSRSNVRSMNQYYINHDICLKPEIGFKGDPTSFGSALKDEPATVSVPIPATRHYTNQAVYANVY